MDLKVKGFKIIITNIFFKIQKKRCKIDENRISTKNQIVHKKQKQMDIPELKNPESNIKNSMEGFKRRINKTKIKLVNI